MRTINKITFEDIKDLLPKSTSLYYVDYRDSLDEHTELIQLCIEKKCVDPLYEAIDEWYQDSPIYAFDYLDKELVSDICKKFDIEDDEAEEIIDEFRDYINDHYYNVDDSTVLKDLCRNTSSLPIRLTMYSNHDCINSHWFETSGDGGYTYKDSYFGDMVDVLNLNPAKVKKMLLSHEVNAFGNFPNLKYRDGKEFVSYESFWQELQNSCCGANLLTFVGLVDVEMLIENNFELKEVTIPKGNNCGLYSSMQGGGSVIEMELLRDFKVKLNIPRKNKTKWDTFGIDLDENGSGYSIDNAYGVTRLFWGREIS